MGIFSKFEGRVEDGFEGAANKMFDSPISPVQIAKKAEKQMRREKMVGAGKQYAPTLYTVLVNAEDDQRLFGYYPTLAGETETYLSAKAVDEGLTMDGQPLVRFIVDEGLRRGKFDVVAEMVSAPIISQLREEEMERYGISQPSNQRANRQPARSQERPVNRAQQQNFMPVPQQEFDPLGDPDQQFAAPRLQDDFQQAQQYQQYPQYQQPQQPMQAAQKPPLPYVPEDELDYSINYGEYTFDSQDFDDYYENGATPGINVGGRAADGGSFPVEGTVASVANALPGMGAAAVAGAIPRDVGVPNTAFENGGQRKAPNTVVFTPGAGNARPVANSHMVRASLMNATDDRNYDLATSRVLIGRESSNDIAVDDINASRVHAELKYEPQGVWVITDLGSTNGTLVNNREITSQALRDGDYITIGMTNFVFIQS